jgi:pyrimidine-nucleoside phosphorylase
MRVVDLIIKKRDGGVLEPSELAFFVNGVTTGAVPDYQASALLMAIVLRGMSGSETAALTDAMVRSGVRVDLSDLEGAKVDKHSTGGVGDKTSLIVAPVVAACGVLVPMMSGRGLGHTGGTLDKLEAIPGFRATLSLIEMKRCLSRVGCAMLGQTDQIAPADKKLYALRDVTGTVESIPLISASIMSKKIAEGIDGLVLDVKTGSGAFMKTGADSLQLAESLVSIGRAAGLNTQAVVTDMDAPLGRAVGNSLEVLECLDVLKGHGPDDLLTVSVELASRMLVLAGASPDRTDAERRVRAVIQSGSALEKFRQIVETQGGDPRIVDEGGRMPAADRHEVVRAPRPGYLARLDAELVGRASVALGAGRNRVEDVIDPGVGIMVRARPGDAVAEGDPVLELLYRDEAALAWAIPLASRAIEIRDAPADRRPLLVGEVH